MANWPASAPSATPADHTEVAGEVNALGVSLSTSVRVPAVVPMPYKFTSLATMTAFNGDGYLTAHIVDRTISINRVFLYVAVSSGNIDVGIYDDDGAAGAPLTRLVSSGAAACPASGHRAITVADTVLTPGRYYTAISFNNSVAQFRYGSCEDGSAALYVPRYDAATAHPLPATISGTPTAVSSGSIWFIGMGRG